MSELYNSIIKAPTKKSFPRVRELTLADSDKAARTLLDSFTEDSLAQLLTVHMKDEQKRVECEYLMYKAYARQHILKGVVLGIGELEDRFETVAIWSHPDSIEIGLEGFATLMEAGYDQVYQAFDSEGREKVFEGMIPLLHDSSVRILSTDSRFNDKALFTLVYVGSTTSARGKGNVRTMFTYMFENYIDKWPNSISYLESSSTNNIPIYNRFGFIYKEDIVLGSRFEGAVEGVDFADMNIMIRGNKGHDWTKDDNTYKPSKL